MGIFKRISDIVSANLNELTDSYEDPEKMLKQAIREMESSIADATQQTAKAMASEKTMGRELDRNRQQAQLWKERATQAVQASDDELAKKALVRKNEHEKLVSALQDQLESAGEASGSLKRQLEGMKAKLAEAKRNLATLSARQRAANFRRQMETSSVSGSMDVDDNAFAKFDRLKSKVEQAEAEAEALSELRDRSGAEAVIDEMAPREEDLDIAAQLAELKRAANKG